MRQQVTTALQTMTSPSENLLEFESDGQELSKSRLRELFLAEIACYRGAKKVPYFPKLRSDSGPSTIITATAPIANGMFYRS